MNEGRNSLFQAIRFEDFKKFKEYYEAGVAYKESDNGQSPIDYMFEEGYTGIALEIFEYLSDRTNPLFKNQIPIIQRLLFDVLAYPNRVSGDLQKSIIANSITK